MHKFFRFTALAVVFSLALSFAGCDQLDNFLAESGDQSDNRTPPSLSGLRNEDSIVIASFNIQVFGQSKLKKAEAMDVLAQTVRKFDIVAIQEIRAKADNVMPDFLKLINAEGHRYDFIIGERLGRTVSKEQYAFVYDTDRIEFVPGSMYTVPDPGDQLHRQPLAATFRARVPAGEQPFSFTLVNIHTDPDETKQELNALDDSFRFVQQKNPTEDDIIVLGDLNVDSKHLGELGQMPNITWIINAGTPTNTRLKKSYDNLVFDKTATTEYQGTGGVMNLMTEFKLSESEALKVSDHLPVWAVFSKTEGGATRVASKPK